MNSELLIDEKQLLNSIEKFASLGMNVTYDDIGNIYGALPGKKHALPIVMGSHLDTVKNGGKYDGSSGIIGGIEVIRVLV